MTARNCRSYVVSARYLVQAGRESGKCTLYGTAEAAIVIIDGRDQPQLGSQSN
jgi:hypothetical protein